MTSLFSYPHSAPSSPPPYPCTSLSAMHQIIPTQGPRNSAFSISSKTFSNNFGPSSIIRILFMIPVYTICCTLSINFYRQNVYLGAVYEFYESLVLACFFLLLCNFLVADLDGLRRVFAVLEPQPWIWPIRIWQLLFRFGSKRGLPTQGLKWFHVSLRRTADEHFADRKSRSSGLECFSSALSSSSQLWPNVSPRRSTSTARMSRSGIMLRST